MKFADWLIARVTRRAPDFVIGGEQRPYLKRWWVIPQNRLMNVYLHQFLRSDDDRAEHDHPWANVSWLLQGYYWEWRNDVAHLRIAGDVVVRPSGRIHHRIQLIGGAPVWTLFVTGPKYREWGFLCPNRGWVHWKLFTAADDPGSIGKGCDA